MLLVDDDQAEILDRREHGRARAHAHPRLPRAQAPPLLVALAGAKPRVKDRDRVPKALGEASHDLRGQRDLRDEHDRPAPLRERDRCRAQVDLGLARSRDAVQQPLLGSTLGQGGASSVAEAPSCWSAVSRGGCGLSVPTGRCRSGATARRLRPLNRRAAPGGSTRASARAIVEQYSAAIQLGQRDQIGRHAELERTQRREQLLFGDLAAVGEPDDHAQHLAAAERHDEHRADVHRAAAQLLGQPVVERAAQRAGARHRLDLGDG